jgi:hypothetical protein
LIADGSRDQVTLRFFFQHPSATGLKTHFPETMTFSEDYGKLLSPFLKEYKKANNEKARKAVIKNAADAISSSSGLLEDKGASLPKNLKTVCLFFPFFFFGVSK